MTINFSNRSIEASLIRIADSLDSIDFTLQKITTQDDFTEEDKAVKAAAKAVEAATGRVPKP
jgi:hypothetical protein